jgi:hypothetical protein
MTRWVSLAEFMMLPEAERKGMGIDLRLTSLGELTEKEQKDLNEEAEAQGVSIAELLRGR